MTHPSPSLSFGYGVMYQPELEAPFRYVGLASFLAEPEPRSLVVVGGFVVSVHHIDSDGFLFVTGAQLPVSL